MIARTEAEARRQAAIAERRKALFERGAQPRIRKAINAIGAHAGELYEQGGKERLENMLKTDAVGIMAPVLLDLYERIIKALSGEAKQDVKCWGPLIEVKTTEGALDVVTEQMLLSFQTYALTQSTVIADQLTSVALEGVTRIIASDPEIISRGPRAVASSLREYYKGLSGFQAERIARTETLMAYSEAQNSFTEEIWDEAEDGPLYKKWYANRDRRTRDDHKRMNGKIVRQEEKFVLPNGDELRYPGDREARKAESFVNCRCSWASLPQELVPQRQR